MIMMWKELRRIVENEHRRSLSVVIAVFNGRNTISQTIGSVIASIRKAQFDSALISAAEIIIVDDNSSDDSVSIVEEVLRRSKSNIGTTVVKHKINKGVASARYEGLKHAKGEIIHILDQDDLLHPLFYSKVAGRCSDGTAIVVNGIVVNECGDVLRKSTSRSLLRISATMMSWKLNNLSTYIFGGNPLVSPGCVAFHSSAMNELLTFYQTLEQLDRCDGVDDGFLYPYLLNRGITFHHVRDKLFVYRRHSSNQSSELGRIQMHYNARRLGYELFNMNLISKRHYHLMKERVSFMLGLHSRKGAKKLTWILMHPKVFTKKVLNTFL